MAIHSGDSVIVVESAHQMYPAIYKTRFDGVKLALEGEIIKEDGKFKWVKPTKLQVVK